METVEKFELSRTVKHGALSVLMFLDVEKELGPNGVATSIRTRRTKRHQMYIRNNLYGYLAYSYSDTPLWRESSG
jgi:hypothetical protein